MARKPRTKTETGIYHIMQRGVNRQQIFEDSEDEDKYYQLLNHCRKKYGFKILAYCLMGNHVHLLLEEGREPFSSVFRSLGASYVVYYNRKYKRVGPLFQDRYRSEPVASDEHLLQVFRYIHRNPVKAGICRAPEEYRKSSWRDYLGADGMRRKLSADTEKVLSILSREELILFVNEDVDDGCLEFSEDGKKYQHTDREAKKLIYEITGCTSANDFQDMDADIRNRNIQALIDAGLSRAQLSRLTGLSFGIIRRALA